MLHFTTLHTLIQPGKAAANVSHAKGEETHPPSHSTAETKAYTAEKTYDLANLHTHKHAPVRTHAYTHGMEMQMKSKIIQGCKLHKHAPLMSMFVGQCGKGDKDVWVARDSAEKGTAIQSPHRGSIKFIEREHIDFF